MGKFINNKAATLQDLEKSGLYSKELIETVKKDPRQDLSKLITDKNKEDIEDFMEPLLYATKLEHNTFIIFKYYLSRFQNNTELGAEIIKEEPELILKTPLSSNTEFIKEHANKYPNVVKYMSPELKVNTKFVNELYKEGNKELNANIINECDVQTLLITNIALRENSEFMQMAIIKDANMLQYASEDLKNNPDFLKNVCKANMDVIDYVAEHTEDFGKESLSATKEVLVEVSTERAIKGFEDESNKIKEEIEQKTLENKEEKSDDLDALLKRNYKLQKHADFFRRIKNGEIDQVRAAKLMDRLCKNLDEKSRKEIESLIKIDESLLKKEQVKYNQNDIENATEGAKIGNVQQENIPIKEKGNGERVE